MRQRRATELPRRQAGATALALVLALPGAVAGTWPGLGSPAHADSIDDQKKSVDQQIADLKDTLEGATADFVDAAVALKQAQIRLAAAQAALVTARKALAAAAAKDAQLAAQVAFAQAQQDKAARDVDAQIRAEQQTRAALGQIARDAYVDSGLSGLSVVLQATSPDQLTDRLAAAATALRVQSGAIDRLAVERAQLRARSASLDALRAQVTELKRQSEIVVARRKEAQDAAAAAQAQVAALVAQEQKAVDDIQSKIAAEKQRLDALTAEQDKLKALLVARAKAAAAAAAEAARRRQQSGGAADAPSASGSGFLSPAANGPITSGFGMRYHPILHITRMHTGIDFGIPCGSPVYAAAEGEVISAGWAGGYGNRVVIDHGIVRGVDLATTYNHLTSITAGGGRVGRGELIGYSGTTGLSTGCHLHFETLVDGAFVDPMGWL
jgi:murein DD-endopeptidase MepM/ murein hydrolase activator NlpD